MKLTQYDLAELIKKTHGLNNQTPLQTASLRIFANPNFLKLIDVTMYRTINNKL